MVSLVAQTVAPVKDDISRQNSQLPVGNYLHCGGYSVTSSASQRRHTKCKPQEDAAMNDFTGYDELDSQILRRLFEQAPPHNGHNTDTNMDQDERIYVDPSSTAFIDGSCVEALLRRSGLK
jgi:hypothetical protein